MEHADLEFPSIITSRKKPYRPPVVKVTTYSESWLRLFFPRDARGRLDDLWISHRKPRED